MGWSRGPDGERMEETPPSHRTATWNVESWVFAEIGDEAICDRGKMLQPSMLWGVGRCLRRLSLSSFLFILSGCSTISAP